MPAKKTLDRARKAKQEGKAPSTQAGEFVREEIEHVREGKHGVRSAKQAIAIGLSKARRAGVALPPPKEGAASPDTRRQAVKDLAKGKRNPRSKPSAKRSAASKKALQSEPRSTVSKANLSKNAKQAAAARRGKSRNSSN